VHGTSALDRNGVGRLGGQGPAAPNISRASGVFGLLGGVRFRCRDRNTIAPATLKPICFGYGCSVPHVTLATAPVP
jgi:hypothetical protein